MNWSRYPFVRLLLPLMAGIFIAIKLKTSFQLGIWIILSAIPCLVLLHYFQLRTLPFRKRYVPGVGNTLMSLLLGIGITGIHNHQTEPTHFQRLNGLTGLYRFQIADVPSQKAKSIRLCVNVLSAFTPSGEIKCSGRVMTYFQTNDRSKRLRYGDQLIAQAKLSPVPPALNPHSFDYRQYLANQGIYHQSYLSSDSWRLTQKAKGFTIYRIGTALQEKFILLFAQHRPEPNELTVASALVLGYDENIEPELRNAYINSGTLHILSVSGLHVGVLYLVLSFLLRSLKRNRWLRWVRATILFGVVWFYALITGLSPAVLRSAAMLSFIIAGEVGEREQNTINTVAASAFILLIIDPLQITDIGFELSYLAVVGIVIIEPAILSLWNPENKVIQLIWGLTCVSIAAQITSTPLSLYYFHQFPNYFIFSNYAAIPLSSLAIYSGMLTLLFSPFAWISHQLAHLFFLIVALLNRCIVFFGQLPYATFQNIQLSLFETIVIYCALIFLFIAVMQRDKKALWASLLTLIVFGISWGIDNFKNHRQSQIVVYSISGTSVVDYFHGTTCYTFQSFWPLPEDKVVISQVKGTRIAGGIKKIRSLPMNSEAFGSYVAQFMTQGSFYLIGHRRLAICSGPWSMQPDQRVPLVTDYLLLTGNPYPSLQELLSRYRFKQLILDGSNSLSNALKWKKLCNDNRIPCHSTASDGAFVLNAD